MAKVKEAHSRQIEVQLEGFSDLGLPMDDRLQNEVRRCNGARDVSGCPFGGLRYTREAKQGLSRAIKGNTWFPQALGSLPHTLGMNDPWS